MPDAQAIARMYGLDYAKSGPVEASIEDPKSPEAVLAFLEGRAAGTFVDFGCGSGTLLRRVGALGWTPIGVEYDAPVAAETEAQAGCRVFVGIEALRASGLRPEVINLGDVIEHLPVPLEVVMQLVALLRPGGWLLAQGPLEAGPCAFTAALHTARRLRGRRVTHMPPYHVLQATVRGQRAFFDRLGLEELAYVVSEVAWPAPARLSTAMVAAPRLAGLFLLRRASQAISALNPTGWGNRYFYAGLVRKA